MHVLTSNQFPAPHQNAVYFLGNFADDLHDLTIPSLAGTMIVFNARRKTVRAYRATRRALAIVARLGWGWIGYIGEGTQIGFCDASPAGSLIPDGNARLWAIDSCIVWRNGRAMFLSDNVIDVWSKLENDLFAENYAALQFGYVESPVWGKYLLRKSTASAPKKLALKQIPYASIPDSAPYMGAGISAQIRGALVSQLGYHIDVADQASISWRKLDNGQFGWIAELPNGAAHNWQDGQFVVPAPRVQLTKAQVGELLFQLDLFANVVNSAFAVGNLDKAEEYSVFAIGLAKMVG